MSFEDAVQMEKEKDVSSKGHSKPYRSQCGGGGGSQERGVRENVETHTENHFLDPLTRALVHPTCVVRSSIMLCSREQEPALRTYKCRDCGPVCHLYSL